MIAAMRETRIPVRREVRSQVRRKTMMVTMMMIELIIALVTLISLIALSSSWGTDSRVTRW